MNQNEVARTKNWVKAMKQYFIYIVALLMACVASVAEGQAQNMPERGLVRKGNRQFANQRYEQSADSYQQALVYDSTSFEARYNLGNTYIRQAMADTTAPSEQAKISAVNRSRIDLAMRML